MKKTEIYLKQLPESIAEEVIKQTPEHRLGWVANDLLGALIILEDSSRVRNMWYSILKYQELNRKV